MKNTTMLLITIALIAIIGIGIFVKTSSPNLAPVQNQGTGDAQKITLSLKNLNYYPNTITVNVNQPVQIYLDKTVSGCLRAFTIPELGISKYLQTPEEYVEFTPTKTGTFRFQCTMGMGYGTIIVE